jgi:hypothetical protein
MVMNVGFLNDKFRDELSYYRLLNEDPILWERTKYIVT